MTPRAVPRIRSGGSYADVTFTRVDLTDARFRDVVFADCVFDHCTLRGTEFTASSFTGCVVRHSDASLARFPGTRLMDLRVTDAKLVGVDWTIAELPTRLALSVGFERSIVNQSAFFGLNLRGLRLTDCVAHEADFTEADLTDATLARTDLRGARFADTILVNADFRGATDYAIDPLRNRLSRARFSLPEAAALLAGLGVVIE